MGLRQIKLASLRDELWGNQTILFHTSPLLHWEHIKETTCVFLRGAPPMYVIAVRCNNAWDVKTNHLIDNLIYRLILAPC